MKILDSTMGAPPEKDPLADMITYPWPAGKYIPHEPSVTQDAFLWLQCLEALYGGAAGGGKSDALLMAALQYIDVPGYAALLLRKTFTELMLENALLDRSNKWLAHTDADFNGEQMRWSFPSGARIQFGYIKTLKDRERYQSAEFQYIAFDELTQFDETDYRFMYSRLRRPAACINLEHQDEAKAVWVDGTLQCNICGTPSPPSSVVPLRMRAATNPGGRGHKWVKNRFIKPWLTGVTSPSRVFIPAKLSDNPHIDQTSYRAALAELEPELVEQLLEGNWDAREPGEWMMRDPRWIDAAADLGAKMWHEHKTGVKRLPTPVTVTASGHENGLTNCIDWGEHTQGYVVWPLPKGGIFVPPSEVVRISNDPAETTKALLEASMAFEHQLVQTNYDAAGIQSMRTYLAIARKLSRFNHLRSTGIPFNKYKRECIGYLRTLARRTYTGEEERILAIHPANEELNRQLKWWRRKDAETDDAVKEDDHGPDALVAGVAPTAREWREYIEQDLRDSYGETDTEYDDEEGEVYGDS